MLLSNQHTFFCVIPGREVLYQARELLQDFSSSLCRTNLPARRGLGLRLIDFRAAIDTRQFPDDQMFTGTPPHLDAVVMDGQPWKWQLDYCGLAMCVISLISNRSGVLVMKRDASSGLYSCSKRLYK